jgi:hypothetical protein
MRIEKFHQFNERFVTNKYKCKICGGDMYRTDAGGQSATIQCASEEAKFWNFPRGSKENADSHKHFMKSIQYVPLDEWRAISK